MIHTLQKLDDYEAELDIIPIWININKAIKENNKLLKDGIKDKNNWVDRETIVLKILLEEIIN